MKIAVSSYSFTRMMNEGKITQLGCIKQAKEMGFDGIEFVGILPSEGESEQEYAKKLRDECEREGMPVTNYTFGADFLKGSDGDLKKEIERIKKEIDIAELLGAKSVRHDATTGFPEGKRGGQGFDQALPRLAEGCHEVTCYAQTKGIRTMIENHGIFCQDSDRVEKLVNTVAHENFGLLCDMGNFLCVDEDPTEAFSRVAPYAFYVHAKDFLRKYGMEPNPGEGFFMTRGGNYLRGTIIGHGIVPVKQCLAILKNAGYQGDFAIEFEGMEDNLKGISIGLSNLRRYVSEVFGE